MDFSIWTMRDGKEVPIKQMTTLHIKNCISMLKRNAEQQKLHGETIKLINGLVSFLGTKASNKSERILDQADTDLMVAELLLENSQNQTIEWIKTFENELRLRETN